VRAVGLGTLSIALLATSALVDQDSGMGIWRELREDLVEASSRVERLEAENDALQREIELLDADPAAIDRAIREEMDLALPGEVVVRFVVDGPASDGAVDGRTR